MDKEDQKRECFLDFFEDREDPRLDRKQLHRIAQIMLVTFAGMYGPVEY